MRLWWTRFCERDFGLPEASPNDKYRLPGFELCPKGVFVDLKESASKCFFVIPIDSQPRLARVPEHMIS